jgi:hypothetical protein
VVAVSFAAPPPDVPLVADDDGPPGLLMGQI